MNKQLIYNKFIFSLFFSVFCLDLSGCISISGTGKTRRQANELKEIISKQDAKIMAQEEQLKEKDQQIQQLRKELEGFGVFK